MATIVTAPPPGTIASDWSPPLSVIMSALTDDVGNGDAASSGNASRESVRNVVLNNEDDEYDLQTSECTKRTSNGDSVGANSYGTLGDLLMDYESRFRARDAERSSFGSHAGDSTDNDRNSHRIASSNASSYVDAHGSSSQASSYSTRRRHHHDGGSGTRTPPTMLYSAIGSLEPAGSFFAKNNADRRSVLQLGANGRLVTKIAALSGNQSFLKPLVVFPPITLDRRKDRDDDVDHRSHLHDESKLPPLSSAMTDSSSSVVENHRSSSNRPEETTTKSLAQQLEEYGKSSTNDCKELKTVDDENAYLRKSSDPPPHQNNNGASSLISEDTDNGESNKDLAKQKSRDQVEPLKLASPLKFETDNKSPTSCIPDDENNNDNNHGDVAPVVNTQTTTTTTTNTTEPKDIALPSSPRPLPLKSALKNSRNNGGTKRRRKKKVPQAKAKKQAQVLFRPSSDAYTPHISSHPPTSSDRTSVDHRRLHAAHEHHDMGTISRPNFRNALRRVAMILHQHVDKIERRCVFTDGLEGLFDPAACEAFREDRFSTPRRECRMVRVPTVVLGVVCSWRKIESKEDVPTVNEIYDFAARLFDRVRLSSECSIVCLIYVERLMEIARVPLTVRTWRPVLLTGLLMASKVWQDLSSWNVEFASVYPRFSLDAINRLESQFLKMVRWDLYISSSLYAKYYFALRSLLEKKTFRQRYHDMLAVGSVDASDALKVQRRTEKIKEEALSRLSRSMD